MHKCKYCGAQLSKLDKQICPFCGGLKPLDGSEDVTEDFTKSLESLSDLEKAKVARPKSRVVAIVLAIFLGIFGVNSFYLGFKKHGFVSLAISIVVIGGGGSLLFFTGAMPNAFAFLIPYFVLEALIIFAALFLLTRADVKDGRGEFLR